MYKKWGEKGPGMYLNFGKFIMLHVQGPELDPWHCRNYVQCSKKFKTNGMRLWLIKNMMM